MIPASDWRRKSKKSCLGSGARFFAPKKRYPSLQKSVFVSFRVWKLFFPRFALFCFDSDLFFLIDFSLGKQNSRFDSKRGFSVQLISLFLSFFPPPLPLAIIRKWPPLWLEEKWVEGRKYQLWEQFERKSQVRCALAKSYLKKREPFSVPSKILAFLPTTFQISRNHVWTRQRRKGPRKGRRQTSSQSVAW